LTTPLPGVFAQAFLKKLELHRMTTPLPGVFAQAFFKKACGQAIF
jgi:hypothetical protein